MYSCPPMSDVPGPPLPPSRRTVDDASSKYYREIGTAMIGNQLIIRMERDKNKSKKAREQWDPPCDCDVVEIQRPTSKEGPKIIKGGDNNRILFRVQSRPHFLTSDDTEYRPQAISYQVGSCKGGADTNDQCRTITVYPQLGGPGAQEVHTDRITDGDQSVFLLRVKKKPDAPDQPKRNIELELRTPKPPTPPPSLPDIPAQLQYRGHRCCFKRNPDQQNSTPVLRKSKSNCTCRAIRKAEKSKFDNSRNPIATGKSSTTLNRENKDKKAQKQKSKTNPKHSSRNKKQEQDERAPSAEPASDKNPTEKSKMSESSQTGNDKKSAVVMEYSTVQKIVQILDDNSDLSATKLAMKEQNSKQDPVNKEKKPNSDVEQKLETESERE